MEGATQLDGQQGTSVQVETGHSTCLRLCGHFPMGFLQGRHKDATFPTFSRISNFLVIST